MLKLVTAYFEPPICLVTTFFLTWRVKCPVTFCRSDPSVYSQQRRIAVPTTGCILSIELTILIICQNIGAASYICYGQSICNGQSIRIHNQNNFGLSATKAFWRIYFNSSPPDAYRNKIFNNFWLYSCWKTISNIYWSLLSSWRYTVWFVTLTP